MIKKCPNPDFIYDEHNRCWTLCINCSQPAWSHEQSDPLEDIRMFKTRLEKEWAGEYVDPRDYPPAMKP